MILFTIDMRVLVKHVSIAGVRWAQASAAATGAAAMARGEAKAWEVLTNNNDKMVIKVTL